MCLLVILSVSTAILGESSALNTAWLTTGVRGGQGVVNVLLRINSNKKRGRVAELLSDSDVSLSDHDTSVVDGLGETVLEDLSLKASLEHLLNSHGKSIIELPLAIIEQAEPDKSSEKSLTLEDSGLVVLLKGEKVTSGRSDLGKGVHNPPDFSLVLETVLTDNLELGVKSRLLVRSSRGLSSLRVYGNIRKKVA
jgi:hypothetical protein